MLYAMLVSNTNSETAQTQSNIKNSQLMMPYLEPGVSELCGHGHGTPPMTLMSLLISHGNCVWLCWLAVCELWNWHIWQFMAQGEEGRHCWYYESIERSVNYHKSFVIAAMLVEKLSTIQSQYVTICSYVSNLYVVLELLCHSFVYNRL